MAKKRDNSCCTYINRHLVVPVLYFFVTVSACTDAYSAFRKGLSFPSSTSKNLETFCETVWYVSQKHPCDDPPPNKAPLLPGQECDAPFPNLEPVTPFHDVTDHVWSKHLMDHYRVVQQELLHYLRHGRHQKTNGSNNSDKSDWTTSDTALCQDTNGFSKLTLLTFDEAPTRVAQRWFPRTLEILFAAADNVLAPRPICINAQAPQTGLPPHSDNMNFVLTCHLGLVIPDACCMTMRAPHHSQAVSYSWKEGALVICDTSFVHWTRNDSVTKQSRYVLSFSIWHPALTMQEREGILSIHKALQD